MILIYSASKDSIFNFTILQFYNLQFTIPNNVSIENSPSNNASVKENKQMSGGERRLETRTTEKLENNYQEAAPPREGPASPVSGREGETSHHLLEVSTISFRRTSQSAHLRS